MKVSVITRHAITNYGSFLQAYATQEIIESLGYKCEIIDYVRTDEEYKNIEKTMLKFKPNWNSSWIKRGVYRLLREPDSIVAGKRFEKYRNEYLHLSNRYSTGVDLKNNPPEADVFFTGSDQVWGPIGADSFDECYYLSFVEDDRKKFSYAASFGKYDKQGKLDDEICALLKRYNKILVREDSAVEIINDIGLKAHQVLDPTLLLSREYWIDKIRCVTHQRKYSNRRYILIYQLHNNNKLNHYACELSKRKGLDLIRVSPSFHQITRVGKLNYCPDPFIFLRLVSEAECLITDSFHGTAFAINLNTPFIEVLPDNGTSARNVSILKVTNLADRILERYDDYELFDKTIDFKAVNEIIIDERNISLNILKNMLKTVS